MSTQLFLLIPFTSRFYQYPRPLPPILLLSIEHKGHKSSITPFVGAQLDICEAFGVEIPEEE